MKDQRREVRFTGPACGGPLPAPPRGLWVSAALPQAVGRLLLHYYAMILLYYYIITGLYDYTTIL